MIADPCTPAAPVYNDRRGVRNLNGGTPYPIACGFFVPPCLNPLHGLEGWGILEYPPPSVTVLNLQAAHNRVSLQLQKLTEAIMASNTLLSHARLGELRDDLDALCVINRDVPK